MLFSSLVQERKGGYEVKFKANLEGHNENINPVKWW